MMKKISVFLLIAVMVLSFTACKKDPMKNMTAKEMLQKNVEVSNELKTTSQDFTMGMNIELSQDMLAADPSVGQIVEMINASTLTGTAVTDSENLQSEMNFLLDMNGLSFNIDFYMDGISNMYFKSPMGDNFVTMTAADAAPEADYNIEEMKALNKEVLDIMLEGLTEEDIIVEKDVDFESKEGAMKLTYLTMNFENDRAQDLIKNLIPKIYGNEAIREMMKPSIKSQLELQGMEATDEAIEATLDETVALMTTGIDELNGALTFDKFFLKFGLDENFYARDNQVEMVMTIKDETLLEPITMSFNYDIEAYGFDAPVSITFPELTPENTTSIEDFIMQMMFGGFGM